MNGSSVTGNCANVSSSTSGTLTCADPTSSVLFDDPRGMPVLTGLDGEMMWASQLLTIQTTAPSTDITVDLGTPTFTRVERVEVVMFQCPQWGIGAQFIQVVEVASLTTNIVPNITSCDSLVRFCLPYRTTLPVFTLRFSLSTGSDWIQLAEVTIWGNNPTCPPDIVITAPPTIPTTISPPPNPPLIINTTSVPTSEETTSLLSTTKDITPSPASTLLPLVFLLLLLMLVGVVVVVLVLWRCRHQHTAKEEASHTSSQTHTHPVVSLCEETGQPKLQISMEKETSPHGDNQDDEEEDEMGRYSTIHKKKTPKTSIEDALIDLPQSQLYASIDDSRKVSKKEATQHTGQAAEENNTYAQVDEVVGKDDPTNQLYAQVNKKKKKSERADESILSSTKDEEIEMQCPVDQLYALVDKKKKAVDASFSQSQVTETSVDLTYAQVDDNTNGNGTSSVTLLVW